MFVRFDCGCVGLVGTQGMKEGHHLLISACDSDDQRELALFPRDMTGKAHEPLSEEEAHGLTDQMKRLMNDGHRFRTLRSLLG